MSAPAVLRERPGLTLLPPEPGAVATAKAAQARHTRRGRAICAAACVTGALLPLPFVLAGPYLGGFVYAGLVLSWGFLLPAGGLGVFLIACVSRTRGDAQALLLCIAALAGGTALVPAAGRTGTEAYVSSHADELDAAAAQIRRMITPGLTGTDYADEMNAVERSAAGRFLRERGLRAPAAVDGGLLFSLPAPFAPDVFFADGVRAPTPLHCSRVLRVGGRWFMVDCPSAGED